jgi:deoxyribose-phosphate aldolase
MMLTPATLAAALDSTNLRLDATEADLAQLCTDAAKHRFACVMLYPTSVPFAAHLLAGTGIKIGTVIGFPSGRFSTAAKAAEITAAAHAGAHEVDIVIDYAALIAGHRPTVAAEVAQLTRLAHTHGQLIKVIVETCFLDAPQRLDALRLCEDAGADFIKTSTGFGPAGAQAEHITAWAAARSGRIQLKASGGIKTLDDARRFHAAGATRLGTSNATALMAALAGYTPAPAAPSY